MWSSIPNRYTVRVMMINLPCLLLLTANVFAQAGESVRLPVKFSDPMVPVKLQFPEGWLRKEPPEDGMTLTFWGPREAEFTPALHLRIGENDHAFQKNVDIEKALWSKDLKNFTVDSEEKIALRGKEARLIRATYEAPEGKLQKQAMLIHEGRTHFLLSFDAPSGSSRKWSGVVTAIMKSSRIFPRVNLSTQDRMKFEKHFTAAVENHRAGRRDEAIEEFKTASSILPNYSDLHVTLGMTYLEKGDMAEAAREFSTAIRLDPEDSDAQYALGGVQLRQKNYPEAVASFKKAVGLEPWKSELWIHLGSAYLMVNKYPEAHTALLKAVQLNPQSANAHANLGMVYELLRQWAEAETHLMKALELEPENASVKEALERVRNEKK